MNVCLGSKVGFRPVQLLALGHKLERRFQTRASALSGPRGWPVRIWRATLVKLFGLLTFLAACVSLAAPPTGEPPHPVMG